MPDRDAILRALHCRGQDLMIDAPACDQCEYRFQMLDRGGCDFRRLCRDAAELMTVQEAVVRCNDCKHGSLYCTEDVCGETLIECNRPDLGDVIEIHGWKWFCADGDRR